MSIEEESRDPYIPLPPRAYNILGHLAHDKDMADLAEESLARIKSILDAAEVKQHNPQQES